jgi:hypothetical protein
MGEHDEVTHHLALPRLRDRHRLPKGEGCVSYIGCPCPAEDVGKDQPRGRGRRPNFLPFSSEGKKP